MFNVSFTLEHEGEVHLFQQFAGFLRQAREQWKKEGGFINAAPGELGSPDPAPPTVNVALVDGAGNDIKQAPKPPLGITLADMEEAVTEHAKKHGVPATLEVLQSFGAKRVTDIAASDLTRAYAALWS